MSGQHRAASRRFVSSDKSDPSGTPIASDPEINPDGTDSTLYADGHVGTLDYNLAKQITTDPESGAPALVWTNANGGAVIDDLSNTGSVVKQFTYQHAVTASVQVEQSAARGLSLGIARYAADNNATLPPLDSYAAFESAMAPYVPSADLIDPGTGGPYDLNAAVSGETFAQLTDPADTWLFMNAEPNPDGSFCTGYADSHIEFYYAAHTSTSSNVGVNPLLPAFQPFYPPVLSQVSTTSGNKRQLLWGSNEIWGTSSSGAVGVQKYLGPYDGWTSVAIASNGGPSSKMLWRNDDGSVALWTLNSNSGYSGAAALSPTPSETPIGLVLGADADTRILFSEPNSSASVWTVSSAGAVLAEHNYSASAGASAVGIAISPSNTVRAIWTDAGGSAEVWTFAADGAVASKFATNIGPGWTAAQLAIDGSGDDLILWKQPGGAAAIERLTAGGTMVYTHQYYPYL